MLERQREIEPESEDRPDFSKFLTISEFIEVEPDLIRQEVDTPLHRLFVSSRQDELHYEGAEVRKGAWRFVEENRSLFDFELLSDEASINNRILECYRWTVKVFSLYPETKAAILFGSALLGKATPGDYDFYLLHNDEHASDEVLDGLKTAIEGDKRLPGSITDRPTSATVVATYDEHTRLRLRFLERGPYLVIGRLPDLDIGSETKTIQAVQVFANFSGQAYLSQSPKYNPLLRADLEQNS